MNSVLRDVINSLVVDCSEYEELRVNARLACYIYAFCFTSFLRSDRSIILFLLFIFSVSMCRNYSQMNNIVSDSSVREALVLFRSPSIVKLQCLCLSSCIAHIISNQTSLVTCEPCDLWALSILNSSVIILMSLDLNVIMVTDHQIPSLQQKKNKTQTKLRICIL